MTTVSGSTTPSLDLFVASVLSHLVAVVWCVPQGIGMTARVAEKGRSDPGTCSTGRCPLPRVLVNGSRAEGGTNGSDAILWTPPVIITR